VDFAEFRSRALTEGLRYGEDRMVFLRELAQNARDAGATKIGVSAFVEGADLVVNFGDDGEGMEYDHARRYLFTLYASSKERDARSAGRYGVGFWSVLLFEPEHILIESLTESGESWAVALDGALEHPQRIPCGLRTPGTRVRLRRRAGPREAERMLIEVERALSRYCRYLRRNDRKAMPLPVHLNGKRIDQPLGVDGPCWLAFRDGPVEGAVGLGERPRVELYARGLLVWRGTTLDELRYGAAPADDLGHPEGLAPVYVLNGNQLAVTLERRAVVDDGALRRVRRVARRRMRELVGRYLDGVSPRPAGERLWDWIVGVWEDLRLGSRIGPVALIVALLLAVCCGVLFAVEPSLLLAGRSGPSIGQQTSAVVEGPALVEGGGGRPPAAVPLRSALGFDGPMVSPLGTATQVSLVYAPPDPLLFRTAAVETLHAGRGVVASPPISATEAAPYRCASGCVRVEVEVDAVPGFLVLPVPTGYRVETEGVWLAGRLVDRMLVTDRGEPAIRVDRPVRGALTFRTGPGSGFLLPARRAALLQIPESMRLPPSHDAVSRGAATEADLDRRVELIRAFVEQDLIYDRSSRTVEQYGRFLEGDPAAGWLEFVTTLGRGDCDVKNALLVVMLRRAEVPSRLALGVAGRDGRPLPGMHAWVEYHDGGWVAADATGVAPEAVAAAADGPPAPVVVDAGPVSAAAAVDGPPVSAAPFMAELTERPGWTRLVALIAALVAGLAGLVALVLIIGGRGQRQLVAPGGRDVREKVAAEMLASAIIQPEVWLSSGGLSSRRLLPVVDQGAKMSLAEAFERGRRGRLWLSAERPALVRRAVKRGARILDASDQSFGDIAERLPGIVDLDQVARLRPTEIGKLPVSFQAAGKLIDEVDRLVGLVGRAERTVVPCVGLTDAVVRDVDLSGLGLGRSGSLPERFVAVSPRRPEVQRRARLGEFFPGLAAFLLLDLVLARSGLFRADLELIRRRAARDVLEVAR
jgi:hypothetical protein